MWVLSKTNWDSENSETRYDWRDPVHIMEDLLQYLTYRDDFKNTPFRFFGKSGERIYGEPHTRDC